MVWCACCFVRSLVKYISTLKNEIPYLRRLCDICYIFSPWHGILQIFHTSKRLTELLCFNSLSSRSIKHLKPKFRPIKKEFWRQLTWQKVSDSITVINIAFQLLATGCHKISISSWSVRTKKMKMKINVIWRSNNSANVKLCRLCSIWGDT